MCRVAPATSRKAFEKRRGEDGLPPIPAPGLALGILALTGYPIGPPALLSAKPVMSEYVYG
jgi:hypothetical protein